MKVHYIDGPYAGQTRDEVNPRQRVAVYDPPPLVALSAREGVLSYDVPCVAYVEYDIIGRHPRTGVYYAVVVRDTREDQVSKLQREVTFLRNRLNKVKDVVNGGLGHCDSPPF